MSDSKLINRKLHAAAALFVVLGLSACAGDSPEKTLASAEAYLAKNDSKAAVIQLKNALQARPDWAKARFLLGQALLNAGDPVAALVELEKARQLKHPDDAVVPAMARALMLQGKFKAVIDRFEAVSLVEAPAIADLQTSVAASHLSLGNRPRGEAALTSALVASPSHVPALMARARLLAGDGKFDAALELIDKTLAGAPADHELWSLKGDVFLHGKTDTVAAEAAYRKALSLRSNHLPSHAGIILIGLLKPDLEAASRQVDALKKALPQHPQTKFLEAQVAFARNDDKLAKELALQLLRIAPDDPKLLHLAGAVELRTGGVWQAQAYLQKSLQIAPVNRHARLILAQSYVRAGQGAKALELLAPLLASATPDVGAVSIAAQAHASLGDLKKAESLYATASRLNPTDPKGRTALALTQLALGDVDSAFGQLQKISLDDPGTSADLALVTSHLRMRQFESALKAIDRLEGKSPGKPESAHFRGLAQAGLGQVGEARKSFERSLIIDPSYFPAVESLATLDVLENKPAAAAQRFEAVLVRQPANLSAQMALAGLRARAGAAPDEIAKLMEAAVRSNPLEMAPRLKLIEIHVAAKKWRPALVAAQDAVAVLPANAVALDALGRVQALSGDSNQARATFSKLAALEPKSPLPHLRLADIYVVDKNADAAFQSLTRALAIQPDLIAAQRKLIALEVNAGRIPAALAVAKKIQVQRPKDSAGFLLEGELEAARKDLNAAVAAYRAGIKAAPSTPLAVKLHATLFQSGKRAEADAMAAAWQKDHPKDPGFKLHLGLVALQEQRLADAEGWFAEVVKVAPQHVVGLNNLAWVMAKQGKRESLLHATRANELSPNQPALMETRALALSLNERLPEALELQKKVVQMQPSNNAFRLMLAKMYIQAGNAEQAKTELAILANLGSKYDGQPEVARMLKAL